MKPKVEVQAAGSRKLPPVSVPIESKEEPCAVATAAPEEEPPGDSNGDCDLSPLVWFDEDVQ